MTIKSQTTSPLHLQSWVEDADGAASVRGSDTLGGMIKTTFKF